jgi:DNA-binding response OmpR family regulator
MEMIAPCSPIRSGPFPVATPHYGKSPLILVAEDYGTIGMMLAEDLVEAGFSVSGPFASCAAAMVSLDKQPPHAAILDIELTDGRCEELARELKDKRIPFVILTGHAPSSPHDKAFSGVPWLTKPFSHDEIIGTVRALLEGHRELTQP